MRLTVSSRCTTCGHCRAFCRAGLSAHSSAVFCSKARWNGSAAEPLDDGLRRGGVALHHGVDHSRGVPPDRRGGQQGQLQEGQRLAVGELARRLGGRRGDRVMTQLLQHRLDPLLHRAVAGQRAAGRAHPLAQRQELMEDLVRGGENVRQDGGEVSGVADRVLQAVKGHGPHSVREHVGVGLPEEGTRRLAVEGETRVTDEAAEVVEVPGRVGGGDVGEQVTVARAAPLRERDGLRQVALLVLAGGRHGHALPEGLSLGAAGEAAHRRAAAGAARVPADYVEPAAGDGVQRPALLGNGGHAGVSGPAGIDEQRADPLTGMAGEVTDRPTA